MHRRTFCLSLGAMLAGIGTTAFAEDASTFPSRCKSLESDLGGRLGVACLDTRTGDQVGYRADERFPFCSTFKWLAAAAVLVRVDAGRERLDRRISFSRTDLLEWSPVTGWHADGDGMTLGALCEAAITESDNTAANLLLQSIGGLDGYNRYLRDIGDTTTRLDRHEPDLNEARPGDVRDTTTPAAMADDLRRVLLGDALSPASRGQLADWMLATKTSDRRLRAGMPPGWRLADKTGSGNSGTGTAGDVGVYWPPGGAPIIVAVYLTQARVAPAAQEAAIATVGRWMRERGNAGNNNGCTKAASVLPVPGESALRNTVSSPLVSTKPWRRRPFGAKMGSESITRGIPASPCREVTVKSHTKPGEAAWSAPLPCHRRRVRYRQNCP